jgi:hypothetical protein
MKYINSDRHSNQIFNLSFNAFVSFDLQRDKVLAFGPVKCYKILDSFYNIPVCFY